MTPVRSSTGNELIHEWAEALSPPAHFGHNRDAFEECLTDTRHSLRQPDPAELIVVSGAGAVLGDGPVRELTPLLQILDTAVTDEGPFLRVQFLSDGPHIMERRLCAATRAM
ncbi:barstar family protein [Kitasatospora griseola]